MGIFIVLIILILAIFIKYFIMFKKLESDNEDQEIINWINKYFENNGFK
jgi:hypothetical protein